MGEGLHLPTAAGTLVGLAGTMHVAVGVDALTTRVTLLPILLVLWGSVAILGVAATATGRIPQRPAYLGGIALLLVALVGYVDVYALGVSETVLGVEWQPPETTHEDGGSGHHDGATTDGHGHQAAGDGHHQATNASFLERLASGHYALPSKAIELTAVGLLLVLLARK